MYKLRYNGTIQMILHNNEMEENMLGKNIRKLRTKMNLTQKELGEMLGVSQRAISQWEFDATEPNVEKIIKLSDLFHVSVNELFGLQDIQRKGYTLDYIEEALREKELRELSR